MKKVFCFFNLIIILSIVPCFSSADSQRDKLRNEIERNEYLSNPARMVGSAYPDEEYRKIKQKESIQRKPQFDSIMDEAKKHNGQILRDEAFLKDYNNKKQADQTNTMLIIIFLLLSVFPLYALAKKIFNPKLWEQSKKDTNKGK